MTGLLICAAVVAWCAALMLGACGMAVERDDDEAMYVFGFTGLALIAAALYLAWRAGGAGA